MALEIIGTASLEVFEERPGGVRELWSEWTVVDSGTDDVLVPLFYLSAAAIEGVEIDASYSDEQAGASGLTFTFGPVQGGASAKVTTQTKLAVTVKAGTSAAAYVEVPCRWTLYRRTDNEDIRKLSAEPIPSDGGVTLVLRREDALSRIDPHVFRTHTQKSADAGGIAVKVSESRVLEASASFGFEVELRGLGVEWTIESESSTTIAVEATVPGGRDYLLEWLRDPAGARITAL